MDIAALKEILFPKYLILLYLVKKREATTSEISRDLGYALTTVYRYLTMLKEKNLVEKKGTLYRATDDGVKFVQKVITEVCSLRDELAS